MQDNSGNLQHHIAIDKLHEAHGSWQGRYGPGSIAALQSSRTLAQGFCVQGLYLKAEVQLTKALQKIGEEGETGASSSRMLVMKAGTMLELADVLMERARYTGIRCLFSASYKCLHASADKTGNLHDQGFY